jgi:CHASE3 domain sensor protein
VQVLKSSSTQAPTGGQSLERRSTLWSAMGLGMLLVIAGIGVWTLRQVAESDFWVDHTREVISTNQRLLSDVKDAESAERGYIITGDQGYLDPYRSASEDIPPSVEKLLQLTADNPTQQRRIKNLQGLVEKRMAVFNDALRQRSESGFTAAEAVVIAGQGRTVMKQIRAASEEVGAEEEKLLQERMHTRQARLRNGFIAGLIAALVALVGLNLCSNRRAPSREPAQCCRTGEGRKRGDSPSFVRSGRAGHFGC